MKFRIDWQAIKRDPLHWLWILAYTVAFGILFSFFFDLVRALALPFGWNLTNVFVGMVHVIAGGITIAEGLHRFSGTQAPFWTSAHSLILVSLILVYVIAPFLWAAGLRDRAKVRGTNPPRLTVVRIALSLAVAYYALVPTFSFSPLLPWISLSVFNSLTSAQTVQANKDVMIGELSGMSFRAQTLYLVAPQDGGCGGRWKNIRGRASTTLTLEELCWHFSSHARTVEGLFPQHPSWYSLEVATEDSIVITGVAHEQGDDVEFPNANGNKGRMQVKLSVTPKELHWTWQNES